MADEVKKLAEKTKCSVMSINSKISDIQESVEDIGILINEINTYFKIQKGKISELRKVLEKLLSWQKI